jgi:hypothetical protein
MKKIVFSLFLFILISCNNQRQIGGEVPSRNLKADILMDTDSSLLIGNTNYIKIIDDYLYIFDVYEGYFYTQYDITTNKVSRFGKRGNGKDEIVYPLASITPVTIENTACIGIYDQMNKKIILLKKDSLIENRILKEIPLNDEEKYHLIAEVFILNDSVILATGIFDDYTCAFYKNEKFMNAFVHPLVDKDYLNKNDFYKWALYDGNVFDLSPEKTHLVRITHFGGLIELYKIEGMKLIQVFSNKLFDEIYKTDLSVHADSRYGYIGISINKTKIYALYDGGLVKRKNPFRSRIIHVYNLKGDLVEQIILDREVSGITVDEKDSRLYALSEDKDLLQFNL